MGHFRWYFSLRVLWVQCPSCKWFHCPYTYPRTQALGGRGKRAWYPLFAHVLNFSEIWENRKLLCYIRKTVMMKHTLITTLSAHFLTNNGSVSIIPSSAPSSSLRWVDTFDLSLKKVQVATRLDFCWEKYVIIWLLPGSLCDSHCVTICHGL